LAGLFPKTGHVICSWLGNSPRIAQHSYLLITEDDFARAAGAEKQLVQKMQQRVLISMFLASNPFQKMMFLMQQLRLRSIWVFEAFLALRQAP
jgi:hypothetical protein